MRKLGNILLAILLCVCALFPVACLSEGGNSSEQPTKTYLVMLAESSRYTADGHLQTVEEGGSATFTMIFENGYTFGSVNYDDYAVDVSAPDQTGKRTVTLAVHAVTRDKRLEIAAAEAKPYYSVTVKTSAAFTCENAQMGVEAGGNAVFTLSFDGEYTAKSADYKGEYQFSGVNEPAEKGRREVVLIVKNVQKDELITVEHTEFISPVEDDEVVVQPVEGHAVVRYALNGGSFLDGSGGKDFTVNYSLLTRPRPNASNGTDVIGRTGYTLVCWNTKADGSGTRVGLGSRAPVRRNEAISLYAQWAEWTDTSSFTYSLVDLSCLDDVFDGRLTLAQAVEQKGEAPCAVITAYTGGDRAKLVLPEYIDGYPVGGVYTGAVRELPSLQTVIVAPRTQYIYDRAFTGCNGLTELVLHDGMGGLTDTSFGEEGVVERLYINTVRPLTHKGIEGGYFAHKMEMLIAAEEPTRSKLVVWGTCATMYAIQSDYIEEHFPGRWDVVNMGVVGEIGSLYQVDLIKQYLKSGDAFIQLLDIGIPYAFFADVAFDIKVFQSVEDNYDLIASLDMRDYGRVLSSFSSYVQVKESLTNLDGTFPIDYVLDYLTEDGDAQGIWLGGYDNTEEGPYAILTRAQVEAYNVFETLEAEYAELDSMGIRVFTDISPFNSDGVDTALVDDMQRMIEEAFASITTSKLIGHTYDAMFDKKYIFDANYHLSVEGAELYTKRMFDNLYANW